MDPKHTGYEKRTWTQLGPTATISAEKEFLSQVIVGKLKVTKEGTYDFSA